MAYFVALGRSSRSTIFILNGKFGCRLNQSCEEFWNLRTYILFLCIPLHSPFYSTAIKVLKYASNREPWYNAKSYKCAKQICQTRHLYNVMFLKLVKFPPSIVGSQKIFRKFTYFTETNNASPLNGLFILSQRNLMYQVKCGY